MSNKTPAQEMMSVKRNARDKDKPLRTAKLPITKKTQFVTNIGKVKVNPEVRVAFQQRKVSLLSKREFDLLNRPPVDRAVFGTLNFERSVNFL